MVDNASESSEERIADMERRVQRLERRPTAAQRSRGMLDGMVPPESRRHLRAASREQLMAVRSMLDHWIRRLSDDEAEAHGRERIRIE
jgi:vacuolar-type H+-ATPase subunit E/Vma4